MNIYSVHPELNCLEVACHYPEAREPVHTSRRVWLRWLPLPSEAPGGQAYSGLALDPGCYPGAHQLLWVYLRKVQLLMMQLYSPVQEQMQSSHQGMREVERQYTG